MADVKKIFETLTDKEKEEMRELLQSGNDNKQKIKITVATRQVSFSPEFDNEEITSIFDIEDDDKGIDTFVDGDDEIQIMFNIFYKDGTKQQTSYISYEGMSGATLDSDGSILIHGESELTHSEEGISLVEGKKMKDISSIEVERTLYEFRAHVEGIQEWLIYTECLAGVESFEAFVGED